MPDASLVSLFGPVLAFFCIPSLLPSQSHLLEQNIIVLDCGAGGAIAAFLLFSTSHLESRPSLAKTLLG